VKSVTVGVETNGWTLTPGGHAGGCRTHLIANWPGRIESGGIYREPVHVVDFMPTLLELADSEFQDKARPGDMSDKQRQALEKQGRSDEYPTKRSAPGSRNSSGNR